MLFGCFTKIRTHTLVWYHDLSTEIYLLFELYFVKYSSCGGRLNSSQYLAVAYLSDIIIQVIIILSLVNYMATYIIYLTLLLLIKNKGSVGDIEAPDLIPLAKYSPGGAILVICYQSNNMVDILVHVFLAGAAVFCFKVIKLKPGIPTFESKLGSLNETAKTIVEARQCKSS